MTPSPDILPSLSTWHVALIAAPSFIAGAAALFASPQASTGSTWRRARWASSGALALAICSLVTVLLGVSGTAHGMRSDVLGAVMMLLVAFVGWVIVRYSQSYLSGEREERHYVRWMMITLGTVGLVVTTNNVLMLAVAWTATSFALHRLLTFYGDRPAAVVAAHKKFIVARAADLCMFAAAGLLYVAFDTFRIDVITHLVTTRPQGSLIVQAAALLMACAALLKCAQLPFHGWLIQVMEAPTPVSALLHAGVVNLGGFVLLRFAPLLAEVPAAQALLVVAGAMTAALAALVMTTRISVKVMLAWSTCAQMGFMLMQCGLGVWEMALLHLVAHSLYKAHAFLGAGGAVRRASLVNLAPRAVAPTASGLAVGALLGVGMTLCAGWVATALASGHAGSPPLAIWVLAGIVSLALVPLVHGHAQRLGGFWFPALLLGAFGVALTYFALHLLLSAWVLPDLAGSMTARTELCLLVALCFAALFLMQSMVMVAPHHPWVRRLYPWFYGGLFLDERFNQLAFSLFPPPQPASLITTPSVPVNTKGTRT